MGVTADIEILSSTVRSRYSDIDQVIEQLQQRMEPFTENERPRQGFLKKKFAGRSSGRSGLEGHFFEGTSKWALIGGKTTADKLSIIERYAYYIL